LGKVDRRSRGVAHGWTGAEKKKGSADVCCCTKIFVRKRREGKKPNRGEQIKKSVQ